MLSKGVKDKTLYLTEEDLKSMVDNHTLQIPFFLIQSSAPFQLDYYVPTSETNN